jgi:predicted O-methyltransferase YrrM
VARRLPDVPSDVLRSIYRGDDSHSIIAPAFAEALYRTVRKEQPRLVVEIGMAFGASSIAMLTALDENGGDGQLISIDPHQHGDGWKGLGVANVERAGLAHRHRLIEEPDFLALPVLVRDQMQVEFAYIDGWHTFDYTLLDFFYVDKLLRVGGVVAFNDCHYPAVEKVTKFVVRHRRYREEDVGLPPRTIVRARWHRLVGRRVNINDRYFRKLQTWEPDFRFFVDF